MNSETKLKEYTRNEIACEIFTCLKGYKYQMLPACVGHEGHLKDFTILVEIPGGLARKSICQERKWSSIKKGIKNMLLTGTSRECKICYITSNQFIGCSECGGEFCNECRIGCLITDGENILCRCPFCRDLT